MSVIKKTAIALGALTVAAAGFAGTASARWDGYYHSGYYYRSPPVVYYNPPPRYYYPPPVVYGPGVGIYTPGFNINIH